MMIAPLREDLQQLAALAESSETAADSPPCERLSRLLADEASPPSAAELIRLGADLCMDLCRTVALVLKAEWEAMLARELGGVADQAAFLASGYLEAHLDSLQSRFRPDSRALFDAFEAQDSAATRDGYTAEIFDTLVQEMVAARLYLVPIRSPELGTFADRTAQAHSLLRHADPAEARAFWLAKSTWLSLREELGERLLVLEQRLLQNANIEREWMLLLGNVYLELREQAARLDTLRLRIELSDADPDLTLEQLDAAIRDIESEKAKQLDALRYQVALSAIRRAPGGGKPMSVKDLADYRAECKRVLRELWLLLHPDKLERHPAYGELTEAQKHKLVELWHDVMAIRPEEVGFAPSQLGHDYRSLAILLEARDTARTILANSGIDTDVQLIIRGDTLAEQLEWLAEATARLEHEIDDVQAQMKALLEDEAMQEKVAFLGCSSEQQERVRSEMRARTREYRREADDLQHILETRFGSGAIA